MQDKEAPVSISTYSYQPSINIDSISSRREEMGWFGVILLAGLLPRFVFVAFFPTQPVSDFQHLFTFAIDFQHDIFARGSENWNFFNPGASFILSLVLRAFPAIPPQSVARTLTVLVIGLLPILPFLLWKGVFSLRTRLLTALFLALWPGLIIFSGVFAQDNWVLLPVVGLSTLAVRVLAKKSDGHPVWAALLYVLGLATRQEMLIVLLPLFVLSAIGLQSHQRLRNTLVGILTTGLLLSLLIVQRGMGSGRYALSTSHLDISILGSYVPEAGMGWADPKPYIAATAPELFENDQYKKQALHLVWKEILRRHQFQAVRIFASPFFNLLQMEPGLAFWSLTAPDVLPLQRLDAGLYFAQVIAPKLIFSSYLLHVLFLTALFFSLLQRRRFLLILPLFVAALLKLGFHAVIVSQPRYFLTLIVLEILIVGVMSSEMFTRQSWKSVLISAVLGILAFMAIVSLSTKAEQYVYNHLENDQRTYQFPLSVGSITLNCIMKQGRLLTFLQDKLDPTTGLIAIDFHKADPSPGSQATIECSTVGDLNVPFHLSVYDPYSPGGLPDRVAQIVYINNVESYHHDISAEPGEGWHEVNMSNINYGHALTFKIQLLSINPDTGWSWGRAAATHIRLKASFP